MAAVPDLSGFVRLVTALGPWLDRVVIIGGWAHRLYHSHPHAQPVEFAPLTTLDADIAVPVALPKRTPSIRQLLAASGFKEDFLGDHRPPVTHYRLGEESGVFYAEFLTPLAGSEYTRDGQRKATAEVAGVTSQRLRYVELLLADPWSVDLEEHRIVRIANPVNFLGQKLLIHSKRDRADKAKDILYIHDTLQMFGPRLDELREDWIGKLRPRLAPKVAKTITTARDRLFADTSDAIRRAARIPADRSLSPEAVRESCRYGLEQVFV